MRAFRASVLAAALVSWFAPRTVPAADYYVDPSGSDLAGNGATTNPWQTVNHAIGQVAPGDTIHLAPGASFTEDVLFNEGQGGTPGSPVTVTSDPTNRATLSPTGTNSHGCLVWNAGGVTLANLRFTGPGMDLSGKEGVAAMTDGGHYEELCFTNLEVSGFKNGLVVYAWGSSTCGYRNVVIEDCVALSNRSDGIATWASYHGALRDVAVRGCRSHHNLGDPNAASHTGSGIVLGGVSTGVIEYGVANNNGERCATTGGPVGIWAYDSTEVIIRFCESYSNRAVNCDGGGFDLDGGCRRCRIEYCYAHDNNGAGYLVCQYSGAGAYTGNVLRFNISENDGRSNGFGCIHFWSSGSAGGLCDTLLYGNTVYSRHAPAVRFQNTAGQTGTRLWNNVFVTTDGEALVEGSPATNVAWFQGNAYCASNGAFDVAGYAGLAAWRAATGQETLGGSPSGFEADPRLADPGAGQVIGDPLLLDALAGYRLQPDSPAFNTGLDLSSLFGVDPGGRDFYGTPLPQGSAPDAGAHELVARTITADAGPHGSVSPSGQVEVAHGGSAAFTSTPHDYYHVADVVVDGGSAGATNCYVFPCVTNDRALSVSFAPDLVTNGVPAWWMASFGLTNFGEDAVLDADTDGADTWEEYYAGTTPTSPASVFRVLACARQGTSNGLAWYATTNSGATNELHVQRRTGLALGAWTVAATNASRDASGTNWWWDASPPDSGAFYRVAIPWED